MVDSPALSYDSAHFQVRHSSFVEVIEDDIISPGEEEVPSYEISQLQQQADYIERRGSSSTLHSRIGRNSSTHSFQESTLQQQIHHRSGLEMSKIANEERRNLKRMGLQFLTSRQLFGLAMGRDLSLLAIVRDLFNVLQLWYKLSYELEEGEAEIDTVRLMTSARSSEYLMAALWCIVSGYFTYQILDSLMLRWILNYSPSAVIMRMISMSMFIITIIHLLTKAFNPDGNYYLHVWILISCILTGIYILQSFVTSNLSIDNYNQEDDDEQQTNEDDDQLQFNTPQKQYKKKPRFIDLYNIAVFAVVPIGVASFVTMIGLIRNLLILKLDVENMILNGRDLTSN